MSRARYYDTPQFPDPDSGILRKIPSVTVTVYNQGTTTPIGETLFSADSGGGTLPNPFTVNNGVVEFYLASEKRVSIKFDGALSGYGSITKDMEGVWPDPGLLRTSLKETTTGNTTHDSDPTHAYIRSPNGTYNAYIDNTGEFYAPGLLLRRWRHFAKDYGVTSYAERFTAAAVSSTEKANNATNLANLINNLPNSGYGEVELGPGWTPSNQLSINPTINGRTVGLSGVGQDSVLYFAGNTGPYLNIATGANGITYGKFRDFSIAHEGVPGSGATLRLGRLLDCTFENVKMINLDNPNQAPLISVEMILSCQVVKFFNCTFITRTDVSVMSAAGLVPVGCDFAQTLSGGGFEFHATKFNGAQDGITLATLGTVMRFRNTIPMDTVWFGPGSHLKGGAVGLRFGFGNDNGQIHNLIATGFSIDAMSDRSVWYNLTKSALGTMDQFNHQWNSCWFYGGNYNFFIDNSNGANYQRIIIGSGSYLSGGNQAAIKTVGPMKNLHLDNLSINADQNNNSLGGVVDVGTDSAVIRSFKCNNTDIVAGANAGSCVKVGVNVAPATVNGNSFDGSLDADGVDMLVTPGVRVAADNVKI